MEGYCVKCKSKRAINGGKAVTMKNGRKAFTGPCAKCGTKIYRITGK